MLVVHPGTGSRCQAAEAQAADGWSRAAVCVHGDLVICGRCGELGVIPRPGLGHMIELLPEGATVADAEAVMTEEAEASMPPVAARSSPQGEDRSSFQPEASWRGNDFGFCKATESTAWTDPTFAANWSRLKAEGIPRGAYHYFHPSVSPIDQAHHFAGVVLAQGLHLSADMLAVDAEILVGADGTTLEYSNPQAAARSNLPGALGSVAHAGVIGASAKLFADTVCALTGIRTELMLTYTDLAVGAFLGQLAFAGYPLWIAYPSATFPPSVYPWRKDQTRFWQWAFGGGRGGGDRDAFMGTEAGLRTYLHGAPPPPPPPPAPGRLASKTGDDEMFYFPKGKDAAVTVGVPSYVPGSNGVAPTKLLVSTNAPAQFEWEKGANSGDFLPFNVDYQRSAQEFDLSQLAAGQGAIQFVRKDSGSNEVTGCWA
jgi:Glycosyl hydrolases family 25